MHDRARIFSKKNVFLNVPNLWFFEVIEKFGHYFFWNLIYNESLYFLLCSCTNLISWNKSVLKKWAKILSTNQIARFLNLLYLQNKMMK